jgi:calcium permeable stress-gated cation channel
LLALVCFFNTVPLFVISVLANISAVSNPLFSVSCEPPRLTNPQLTGIVGFLKDWQNASKTTFAIVSGVLPPAVSAMFGYFLPLVMRWLSQYQGALTHSALDRAVVARYFFFLVISQLIIFTLIGVGFSKS